MVLTDEDVLAAKLPPNIRSKLFLNRELPLGMLVAVRLNLNGRVRKGNAQYALQSVHKGLSWRNRVVGYDAAVTVSQAAFLVGKEECARIAAGGRKFPMAAIVGCIEPTGVLEGVEIRFNPKTLKQFVRVDDGRPVRSADSVTVFNTRAYARGNITYWPEETDSEPEGLSASQPRGD